MLTDWFTVLAQVLNFLILVALLKHFLYDRIIRAMNEREQRIKDRLKAADEQKEESRQEAESFRRRQEEIEQQRAGILKRAEEDAARRKEELLHAAKRDRDARQNAWRRSIERDKKAFMNDLRRVSVRQVLALSERLMRELAQEDLERRMVNIFVQKIKELAIEEKNRLRKSGNNGAGPAVVYSAFDVSGDEKKKITDALHEEIAPDLPVDYRRDPELIAGIRLHIDNKRISWNMEDAYRDIEQKMLELIENASRISGEIDYRNAEPGQNSE
ncbi:MAG: F0F1 ATP synthase subunit delta [Desulfobacterales bacterium]